MGKVGKLCDYCKTSAAVFFCRMEKVFMCMICNANSSEVHARHERVGMCEVCEQAPASVTCKADAAVLCLTCDRIIHSANPLARRHQRTAVVPLCETASFQSKSASAFLVHNSDASNPVGESPQSNLLDFDYPGPVTTCHQFHNLADSAATNSVVPVQLVKQITPPIIIENLPEIPFEIDFTASDFHSFKYPAQSISQSVSSSSMDVGVVPDWNGMTDISYPFSLQLNNSTEIVSSASQSQNQPTPLSRIDREARVMRYREKRKNRKFEKTIRYASRKAYAEARPRNKGRFTKRTDTGNNIDCWFIPNSTTYFTDSAHGVVPSF